MFYRTIALIILSSFIFAACTGVDRNSPAEDKSIEPGKTALPVIPTGEVPDFTIPETSPEYSVLDPLPDEDKMIRGELSIGTGEIVMMESFPVQVVLNVSGMLPTPCNLPRAEVIGPDAEGKIYVEMWTLTDPDMVCIQVLQSFEVSIPLGSYESGSYTVYLNDKEVGDFSL
jgi:hypothetical protein